MKQKYVIEKSEDGAEIIVKEYAELDKEMLSLLCQESYATADLATARTHGKSALIEAIRTNNMYPPGFYADQIADAVIGLIASDDLPATELFFDDKELFAQEGVKTSESLPEASDDDEEVVVDDLLEEEIEDDDEEGQKIFSKLKSSLKMTDGDAGGIDDG
ncbi:MAG: hypothetical protein QNJ22_09335 [Desulfosarcinaceae bacterium]|nr:hypothetical protein [Desulfosarcinaceae bacterium]